MSSLSKTVIIGAGICGLTLSHGLRRQGNNPLILEKSTGVGGRMATRRDGQARYDHGAQFIKLEKNQDFYWKNNWQNLSYWNLWFENDKHKFYNARNGINLLAKASALDAEILMQKRVTQIVSVGDLLKIVCETNETYEAESVYLTCPLPQSLEILKNSQINYPKELDEILYAKALVGLIEVEDEDQFLTRFLYQENVSNQIFSISNQKSKGVGSAVSLTVVMTESFSEQYFDQDEKLVLDLILNNLGDFFQSSMRVHKKQLKKWRYSYPMKKFDRLFYALPNRNNIVLAGDAFGGPSVQGAIRSAQAVLNSISG